jgi:hypothetical protein
MYKINTVVDEIDGLAVLFVLTAHLQKSKIDTRGCSVSIPIRNYETGSVILRSKKGVSALKRRPKANKTSTPIIPKLNFSCHLKVKQMFYLS